MYTPRKSLINNGTRFQLLIIYSSTIWSNTRTKEAGEGGISGEGTEEVEEDMTEEVIEEALEEALHAVALEEDPREEPRSTLFLTSMMASILLKALEQICFAPRTLCQENLFITRKGSVLRERTERKSSIEFGTPIDQRLLPLSLEE